MPDTTTAAAAAVLAADRSNLEVIVTTQLRKNRPSLGLACATLKLGTPVHTAKVVAHGCSDHVSSFGSGDDRHILVGIWRLR